MQFIQRLRDEGADIFVLSSSLNGIIAQRLVKSLCECKVKKVNKKAQKFLEKWIKELKQKRYIRVYL